MSLWEVSFVVLNQVLIKRPLVVSQQKVKAKETRWHQQTIEANNETLVSI